MASTDGGAHFTEHDSTAFLPAVVDRPVDQVVIYVPHRRLRRSAAPRGRTPVGSGAVDNATAAEQAADHAWARTGNAY